MSGPTRIVFQGTDLAFENTSTTFRHLATLSRVVRPILKWPGGKQWLAPYSHEISPKEWSRYIEPFVGGASFYLALGPKSAILSDINEELITTYCAIADDAESVVALLETYPHSEKFFQYIRRSRPRRPEVVAAKFLYLNRTCWNGLYRVNKHGIFNTPFGSYDNPEICNEERIFDAACLLSRAKITVRDFGCALGAAREGDFAYCDPPYITGHHNNGFVKYNAHLFAWSDQERLARCAIAAAERGAHVLVSNADHDKVVQLYKGFFYYKVARRSLIAGDSARRGMFSEAILSTYRLCDRDTEVV